MGLAIDDVVVLTFQGTLFSQRIMTVLRMGVVQTDPLTTVEQDLEALLLFFKDGTTGGKPFTELLDCQVDEVTYGVVRVQRVFPSRTIYYQDSVTEAGTNTGDSCSANVAGVVIKRSQFPGKKGRGSVHIAGIGEVNMTNGLLEAGQIANMEEFGESLEQTWTPAGTTLTVRFCTNAGADSFKTYIVDTVVDDRVKTMRRRTLRIGE